VPDAEGAADVHDGLHGGCRMRVKGEARFAEVDCAVGGGGSTGIAEGFEDGG